MDNTVDILRHLPSLQKLLDHVTEGFLLLGKSGRLDYLNESAAKLLGVPRDKLVGHVVTEAGLDSQFLESCGRARAGAQVVTFAMPRAGGGQAMGEAVPLEGGELAVYLREMEGEVHREAAQQAVRDTAAQLQGVITAAVDGIIAIDERGRIEWLNPAALRIFGYTQEELLGKNVNVLMPEPYHSEHDQYLANYRSTGHKKIIGIGREVRGRRKDGSTFPLDLAVSEVKLENRRLYTGIVRDITQRKEAEQSLLEAKDAAEAASKAKDHFLAMVSHELRTPLNPILVAVSFLEKKTNLDPEVQEEIGTIRRNVEHEAQIVDDLLNLTRLSRGKIELHTEAVDVHGVLRTMLGQFERELDGKDIALTVALRAKERYVWADPTRLMQVLTNLLHNAVKFTPSGGRIEIRTSNPSDGKLRAEIIDSGIGIEPEILQRLFNPFEQGEKTITRRFGGLGLGLAISKGIIDMHGGTLSATSAGKEKGATFTLELQTVQPVSDDTAAHVATGLQPGQRVLLVEDHQDTMRIMAKLLRRLGYTVIPASTVKEALRLDQQESFDMLICDIGLPDGSGLDVVREMKRRHAIKAIAVSGFGQPEDLSRSREAGFVDHLVKPLNFQKLETLLTQLSSTN